MAHFSFSLAKVLNWRTTVVAREEATLTQLLSECQRVASELQALAGEYQQEWHQVTGQTALTPAALAPLAWYREGVISRRHLLLAEQAELGRRVQEQQRRVAAAKQAEELLVRVKERRLAVWQTEQHRQLEELAAESFSAKWVREQQCE